MSFIWASSISTYSDPLYSTGNQRPTLDLQFARGKSLNDYASGQNLVTFTRDSIGTYVDENGVIQTATANTPRFDHDPETGECLGLLVEENRTNSVRNSTNLSPSTYYTGSSGSAYTFTANETTAPDGTNTAGSLVFNGTECGIAIKSTGVTSTTITLSLFAKYVTGSVNTHVRIQLSPGGGVDNYGLFNLTNGNYSASGSVSNVIMTPLPNGWYRCSVTATHSTTWPQNSGDIRIWFHGETPTQTPINNTDKTYVWGVQLEGGSFLTSYIPTSGSSLERAADVVSITGTNFSSWYNQNESTWFGEVKKAYPTTQRLLEVGDSATNQYSVSIRPGPTSTSFARIASNSTYVNHTYPAKFALADSVTNIRGCVNGTLSDLISTGSSPTDNKLSIGGVMSGTFSTNAIARLTYYPVRLPDATLQTITS